MNDSERIRENVERGKAISSIVSLAMGEAVRFKDQQEFWRTLMGQIEAIGGLIDRPVAKSVRQMTDDEARRFEKIVIDFGMHRGKQIKDVPLEWLEWLADQPLQRDVKRYLNSERIKHERQLQTQADD